MPDRIRLYCLPNDIWTHTTGDFIRPRLPDDAKSRYRLKRSMERYEKRPDAYSPMYLNGAMGEYSMVKFYLSGEQ